MTITVTCPECGFSKAVSREPFHTKGRPFLCPECALAARGSQQDGGEDVLKNQDSLKGQQNSSFRRIAKRNHRLFGTMLIIYFALSLLIGLLDIGEAQLAKEFSRTVESVIPAIAETAVVSPLPNSARLILSISWLYIPILYFVSLFRVPWSLIDWDNWGNIVFVFFVSTVASFAFLFVFSEIVPSPDSARFGRAAYWGIKSSIFYVPIWGGVFILSIFPASFVATMSFVCCVNRIISSRRG